MAKDEIYSEEDLFRIKVRIMLKKVFGLYNKKKEVLLDSVVDKMLEINYGSSGGNGSGPVDKLSKFSDQHLDAEKFVSMVDQLMSKLDDRSYDIIELLYVDRNVTNKDIYSEILDMSESHYYRERWKAQQKMYKILLKNYEKIKKWE